MSTSEPVTTRGLLSVAGGSVGALPVMTPLPAVTLLRTASAVPAKRFADSAPVGLLVTGSSPRPAMRTIRTIWYWPTRTDCCMSATCISALPILPLVSKSSRQARMISTRTMRVTASSATVKPASPRLAARAGVTSVRPQQLQRDGLPRGERQALLRPLDDHLDPLEVNEVRGGPAVFGIGKRQVVDVVLLHRHGAFPKHRPLGDGRHGTGASGDRPGAGHHPAPVGAADDGGALLHVPVDR